MNAVIGGPSLPQEAIADILLRPETKRLLAKKPENPRELACLNRLLLEDAYPLELAKHGEAGASSDGSAIQGVPCGSAFTDPDLLKFDRAADQLEEELSSLRSSLEDEEASFSLEEIAQRLREIRQRGRKLSESAASIFTTPSALSQRIMKVLRLRSKPSFSFLPSVFRVDEDNPLLLHDVPLDVFLDGPILDLCDTLIASNIGGPQFPVHPHTLGTLHNIQVLFCNCYPSKADLRPTLDEGLPIHWQVDAKMDRYVKQCVDALQDFAKAALPDPSKLIPGIPVVAAADKSSPAPSAVSTGGRVPKPESVPPPKPDPQSFTVKIDRVGGTRKPVLANVSVQLKKGPTEEEWQSCKGAGKQTLLALFVILGKDGKGKVPRTRFVELCFAPVKGAVLAAQVDHMFENRCGGNSSLKEQYNLHLVNEGTGKKTNEITGPHFETNLTQDEVEQHLKGGPKTPCGGKRLTRFSDA